MKNSNKNELVAFVIGLIVGGIITNVALSNKTVNQAHQTTQPHEDYHVHADFLIYIRDTKIDLGQEIYMTTADQELHTDAHLHDSEGAVSHFHQKGVAFAEFINSLGLTLTDECLSYEGETYCSNNEEQLRLFVNNSEYKGDITDFEITDEDRLLVYYGPYNTNAITKYMNEVKNDACYYSGTCPERGIAPPESCGLTCEI